MRNAEARPTREGGTGGTRQRLERWAHSHMCPDCRLKSVLTVRWLGSLNDGRGDFEVWCPPCGRTGGFAKPKDLGIKSATEMWRENPDSVPIPMANRFADKFRRQIVTETEGLPPELQAIARERYLGKAAKKD